MKSILCLITFLFIFKNTFGYTIPKPRIEILSPRGFRVTIPDDDAGITLFAFHGKLNQEFSGSEPGEFSGEVLNRQNGEWVYENTRQQLQFGDKLYYWIYVQHNLLGYRIENQKYIVPENNRPRPTPRPTRPTKAPTRQTTRTTTTTEWPIDDTTSTSIWQTKGTTTGRTIRPTNRPTIRTTSSWTTRTTTESTENDCNFSITTVNGKSVCKGALIFQDTFDSIDLNKWRNQIKISLDSEDAEFVSYQNSSDICYVKDGTLNIAPKLLPDVPGFSEERLRAGELNLGPACTETGNTEACIRRAELFRILPPIVSCRLQTKSSFNFKYGKVEIRAKMPKGDWIFPQLFLESTNAEYGSTAYSSGQMRVAFIRSNEILTSKEFNAIGGNRLSGGVVLTPGEKYRDLWLKSVLQNEHLGNAYHIYTLIWTDEEITVALDNVTYGTIRGGFKEFGTSQSISQSSQWLSGGNMAPFDKEFHITLGIGVGGISDFPDNSRTGPQNFIKPWSNASPKAELRFWGDKNKWYSTWNRSTNKLQIDYIKVWAI